MTIPGVAAPSHKADIYSWSNGTFTRVFDANAAGLASNADMDGLAFIDNNAFYASFSRNDSYGGTLLPGGVVALDEDVVTYDQGSWTLYFEGGLRALMPATMARISMRLILWPVVAVAT